MVQVSQLGSGEKAEGQKRFAFLTVSLSGHRRPAIALASEMVNRGFSVDFLIGSAGVNDELRTLAQEHQNFHLHSIQAGRDVVTQMDWQRVAASTGGLFGSKCALFECIDKSFEDMPEYICHWREMKDVLAATRPDVVVLDHAHKILQQWAEEHGIPSVVMHTPYFQTGPPTGCARLSPEEAQELDDLMERLSPFKKMDDAKEALGIHGADITLGEGEEGAQEEVTGVAPHTFVFSEPELLHSAHLPPRVHAVGPCFSTRDATDVDAHLLPWLDEAAAAGERVLYVAFGTLANGFLSTETVGTMLDAFQLLGADWRVLWSLPKAQQPLLEQCGRPLDSRRVRVETFVRQRAVLAHPAVKVFMTHGGQTSVNEGIAASCPLVCMPLFCDQFEMAESLHRHGLGLLFHKAELLAGQAARLCGLVTRANSDPAIRQTVARYARLMRIRGGCARAAEVLESIAFVGPDFGELWQGLGMEVGAPEQPADLPISGRETTTSHLPPAPTLLQQPTVQGKKLLGTSVVEAAPVLLASHSPTAMEAAVASAVSEVVLSSVVCDAPAVVAVGLPEVPLLM